MELKPVGKINLGNSAKLQLNLCLICQKSKSKEEKDLRNATEASLEKFKECLATRKTYLDSLAHNIFDRLRDDINHLSYSIVKWHRNCYSAFTSRVNIESAKKKFLKESSTSSDKGTINESENQQRHGLRSSGTMNFNLCIFCQKRKKSKGIEEKLVQVQSQNVVNQLKQAALNNTVLKFRLGAEDPIAAEIKYHFSCLKLNPVKVEIKTDNIYNTALQLLIDQMDAGFTSGHIYSLSNLRDIYNNILVALGKENPDYRYSLLLKKIVDHYGDKIETVTSSQKQLSTLIFPKIPLKLAVHTIRKLCDERTQLEYESLSDVDTLSDEEQLFTRMFYHVAQKIKQDLCSSNGLESITDITKTAAERIVPDSLKTLLNLILSDNTKTEEELQTKTLNIGQDIVFAHDSRKLTPKHIGLGLSIHQSTRSKTLINHVHAAGDCVSYRTILQIETTLGDYLIKQFETQGNIFIPQNLVPNKFLHFATDNIDILEETTDGKGTFHGTQLIAFQRCQPKSIGKEMIPLQSKTTLKQVPTELLNVPTGPSIKNPAIQVAPGSINTVESMQSACIHRRDMTWLTCRSERTSEQIVPSWTDMQKVVSEFNHPISTIGYTPILPVPAHETDTLLAVLQRCQNITKALGQKYTVITADEALYCKLKQIQWQIDEFRDVVIRLGGFHWILNFLKVIGKHFSGSGLCDIWVEADVFGENTALNIFEAKHYNRCIRAVKLTLDALWRVLIPKLKDFKTKTENYSACLNELLELIKSENDLSQSNLEVLTTWQLIETKIDIIYELLQECDDENKSNPMYRYWRTYIDLAGLVLKFIRAEREGNWLLHIEVIAQMLPWFFIYDHTNYARWGSIYVADMKSLPQTAREVHEEFLKGNFVVKQTKKTFNEKSPDQALEHVNREHKVAGGLVGITRTETARDRWCITFNARSDLTILAKKMCGLKTEDILEETTSKSNIKKDETDVQKLSEMLKKCNIFDSGNNKIANIFTGETASDEISSDLLTAKARGQKLANEFISQRLEEKTVDFYAPLKKNKSKTFQDLYKLTVTGKSTQNKEVSINAEKLVRKMFSAAKSGRDIDLKCILKHEIKNPPPSLFDHNNQIRESNKSALANLVQEKGQVQDALQIEDRPKVSKLIDGQALIQAIGKPKNANTFGDLKDIFINNIMAHLIGCQSLHVIFDRYNSLSIKSSKREKRAKITPVEYKISGNDTPLPKKWDRFIHHPKNKANLAKFLSEAITEKAATLEGDTEILTAGGFENALTVTTNMKRDTTQLQSDQEEGDTRFVLHAVDAAQQGYETTIVYSRDTDVLLLLMHHIEKLSPKVWIQRGTAKSPKYVSVHDVSRILRQVKNCLLAYHAITGCDTTSAFSGITKKTSWPVFLENFLLLESFGSDATLTEENMKYIEQFVIAMYCQKKPYLKGHDDIDDLRAAMFQSVNNLDKLPPTKGALEQHLRRANYQTFIWKTADSPLQVLPPPETCGWHLQNDKLVPVTSLRPPLTMKDLQLISCQCTTGCRTSKCSCVKKQQNCMKGVCHIESDSCLNQYNFEESPNKA